MVLNYTLEKHQYFMRKESLEEGLSMGRKQGIDVINKLNNKLLSENRLEDLKRSTEDKEYQDLLIKEFGLDIE